MNRYARFKVLICLALISSCGETPADGSLATLNNDLVSGIVRTDEVGRILGEFGRPSTGGDADGKQVKCGDNSGLFKFQHPYPNPASANAYSVEFEVGCQTDVRITVWESSATEWLLGPSSSLAGIARPKGRKISEALLENLAPGFYNYSSLYPGTISYVGSDYSFNGFYRVMVTAPGFKAWRDMAIFEDVCKAPKGIGFDDFC